jgi:hypothetical protein
MESFRAALDRLTREFVAELFAAVRVAAEEALAERQPREAKAKPTRVVRSTATVVPEARPVVLRSFDIPVGVPRRRRRRTAGAPATKRAAPPPPPPPQVVKFEVVPHPDRKNRRIVLTRLDNAAAAGAPADPPPSSSET